MLRLQLGPARAKMSKAGDVRDLDQKPGSPGVLLARGMGHPWSCPGQGSPRMESGMPFLGIFSKGKVTGILLFVFLPAGTCLSMWLSYCSRGTHQAMLFS